MEAPAGFAQPKAQGGRWLL